MSHHELSQTHPLYWFLLMLFRVAPATPCGLMTYLGANGHRSCVAPCCSQQKSRWVQWLSLFYRNRRKSIIRPGAPVSGCSVELSPKLRKLQNQKSQGVRQGLRERGLHCCHFSAGRSGQKTLALSSEAIPPARIIIAAHPLTGKGSGARGCLYSRGVKA